MNWAHLHLVFNHVPVIGVPFSVALLAVAKWRKSHELERVSAASFVVWAALTILAYCTGCPAKRVISGSLTAASKGFLGRHEDAALISALAVWGLGAISLFALFQSRGSKVIGHWYAPTSLIVGLVAAGPMAWAANLGGKISHTEIRASEGPAAAIQLCQPTPLGEG